MNLPSPVLAVETSSPEGSVALLVAGRPCAEEILGAGTRHGRELHPAVDRLLRAAGAVPADLALVVVGLGPGSFTGMRVGLAAARTLAWALGAPLVGVPSFDALAAAAPPDRPVAAVRDARRDHVYAALYGPADGDGVRAVLVAPCRLPVAEAAALLPARSRVVGDAAPVVLAASSAEGVAASDPPGDRAPASLLARLGARRFALHGAPDADGITPLYLQEGVAPPRSPAPR